MTEVKDTEDTLQQRKSIYGDYGRGLELRKALMETVFEHYIQHAGKEMGMIEQEYVWDIVNKIARIASCPRHVDSWHDIGGYAKRIEEDLVKRGVGL